MSKNSKKIYIGVAWPYVHDLFHIGNLAGAFLPADIFFRFHKLKGNDAIMISGSDFHGTPITLKAEKEGKKPEEVAEKFHDLVKKYLNKLNIKYSLYTSTHTDNHENQVQDMFLGLLENGYIKRISTQGLYSKKSEKFLQDRYVEGKCPYCGAEDARGDQCENCGRSLDALELIDPISKLDGSRLTKKETENYYIDLTNLEGQIKKWLEENSNIRSWIKNEALGWIEEGLKPRAITRDMSYGVPLPIRDIPESKQIENIENKVFYVWFEAVIGYLSGAVEHSKNIGAPDYWKEFFYNPSAETYYFVGQDNLVFHTINWPAQLRGYSEDINLPTNVFVNKFLLLEGKKLSKRRNWFIGVDYLTENYPINSIRFYLAYNNPENKQSNFSWEEFIKINNSILVGNIGNFINRVLKFSKAHFGSDFDISAGSLSLEVYSQINQTLNNAHGYLEKGEIRKAIREIIDFSSFGNGYLERSKIWELVKRDSDRAKRYILEHLAMVNILCGLLYPFLPEAAKQLNQYLGNPHKLDVSERNIDYFKADKSTEVSLRLSSEINPLFSTIKEEMAEKEKKKLG